MGKILVLAGLVLLLNEENALAERPCPPVECPETNISCKQTWQLQVKFCINIKAANSSEPARGPQSSDQIVEPPPVQPEPAVVPPKTISGEAAAINQAEIERARAEQLRLKKIAEEVALEQQAAIDRANAKLREIAKSQLGKPVIDEKELIGYQEDRTLVRNANASLEGKKKAFTLGDADRANNSDIKLNLRVVASGEDFKNAASFEFGKLGALISQLAVLARKNNENDRGLGKLGEGAQLASIETNSNGASSHADALALRSNVAEGLEKEPDKKINGKEKLKNKLLKELLRKQLESDIKSAEKKDKLEEEFGAVFDGSLASGALSVSAESNLKSSKENNANVSINDQTDNQAFPMAGSETDRKIASIVSEVTNELGSDEQMGILEESSLSLFERINNAHRECVAKKCVTVKRL